MTKKNKKQREVPSQPQMSEEEALEAEGDQIDEDLPVRVGVYSQQELAFGDMMRAIFSALSGAYDGGMTRKDLRKASGVKKKTFRRIENMDLNTSIGDVLRVLAAANKTLAVVPLNQDIAPDEAVTQTMSALEDELSKTGMIVDGDLIAEREPEHTAAE